MSWGYDPHGLVECLSFYLDKEVDGIAIELAVGPDPEVVFYDEPGRGGWMFWVRHDAVIAVVEGQEAIAAAVQERRQIGLSSLSNSRFGPGHGCFSSGVG